jgi:nitronate monooxygenase
MVLIGQKSLELPIIQGGMGIGISLGGLAGEVARWGGMGVISAANPGYNHPDFWRDAARVNLEALRQEVHKAREISGGQGIVAVNVMVAAYQYADLVRTAVKAGADAIICGAGLPTKLPALMAGSGVAIAPIVSSGKAARTICRLWDRHHGICPDFVVVEGPEAGGHLGFKPDELEGPAIPELAQLLTEVLAELEPFRRKYGRDIPVFAAGGVFTGADIARYTALGAAGAQIATRFIATYECDASPGYKQRILDARPEDVVLLKSPVGMPGRGLRSPLIERMERGERVLVERCTRCLHPCNPATTPYCITRALIEACRGNWEQGLFFCGSHVGRVKQMVSVQSLLDRLTTEWRNSR